MFAVLSIFLSSSWATPTPTGDTGSATSPATSTGDTGTASPTTPTTPGTDPTTPGTDPTTSDTAAAPAAVTAASLAGEVGGCHCSSGRGTAPWLLMSLGAVAVVALRRRVELR
ncbi:MAG: hypothetical protein KTR31_02870 [Myxococcales bacterium]|nr:hypothetical protein [Myxococcales bacterium]